MDSLREARTGPQARLGASVAARAAAGTNPIALPQPPIFGGIGVSRGAARVILVAFIVVHAVLAFADNPLLTGHPLEALAFLAVTAAAVWLSRATPDPLPRARAVGVLALCCLTAVLMSFQISPVGGTPFSQWHMGAITLILVAIALLGRPRWAWGGYVGLAVITTIWALAHGLTVGDGISLVIRHAGTLLAGSLFAVGLQRSARTLGLLNREFTEHSVTEAAAFAALEEREAHLARVNALARPALTRLAAADDLDPNERAECLLVEASLRDAMRGRALFVGSVIRAARAARARGVEVTLLDDSGDQPPTRMAAVAHAVAEELGVVASGRFTARVLPADRPVIATIVVESAEHRMLVVTPDGIVRDE